MPDIGSLEYWLNYRDALEVIIKTDSKTYWDPAYTEVKRTISTLEQKMIEDEITKVNLYINLLIAIKRNNGYINVEPIN